MSPSTLKMIISAIFIFHGIGHLMGIIPTLHFKFIKSSEAAYIQNWTYNSWLMDNIFSGSVNRIICALLYSVCAAGFIGAGLGIYGKLVPFEYWRMLALIFSIISLFTLFFYWNAFIFLFPHKIGAILINAACLILLLQYDWPSDKVIGF